MKLVIVGLEVAMLCLAGFLAAASGAKQAAGSAAFMAALALFVAAVTIPPMFVRIDFQPWRLDCQSLFGPKHVEIRDLIRADVASVKGTRYLTVSTGPVTFSISEQTISRRDLDDLVDLIFAGAAATSNTRLHRPVPQKKFSDFARPK